MLILVFFPVTHSVCLRCCCYCMWFLLCIYF